VNDFNNLAPANLLPGLNSRAGFPILTKLSGSHGLEGERTLQSRSKTERQGLNFAA